MAQIASIVNQLIDTIAATRVLCMMWQIEGCEELDVRRVALQAAPWASEKIANDQPIRTFRWPKAEDMVCDYYKARSSGPVKIATPQGCRSQASYHLNADACRSGQSLLAPGHHPVPLLIRCPALPGTPEAVTPDGRCVKRLLDGTVITSYWKDGKLHRDPGEGPAWHRIGPMGERTEYMVEGQWHRDDGPSLIDDNFDGEGLRIEECHRHGVVHRPSSEGPALLNTNASGHVVFEVYVEDGDEHRDPDTGPSLVQIKDGKKAVVYHTRGKQHRPEMDGPARTVTDLSTGAVIEEEYCRDGLFHRDGGPAFVTRQDDGSSCSEIWFQNGEWHRDPKYGPAITHWSPDGTVTERRYCLKGEFLPHPDTIETCDA